MVDIRVGRQMANEYLEANIPSFFWGPPGIGKSDTVHQMAKEREWGMVDFRAVLRDPVDLRGIPATDLKAKRTIWLSPDELPQEKRDGKEGILFLDELNAASPQVQAACFGLVLDRKVGEYRLPDGWRIIAAGNRQSDRSAAQRMPRALANRFAHIEAEADAGVWIEDYANHYCDPLVVAFIRFRPGLIHKMDVDDERMFPTPRAWASVSKVCNRPDHIRRHLVRGLVGEAATGEFEGFVKTWRELPDFDEIIRRPKDTHIPEEPSALYAVSTALGRYAERENFNAVMTYAQRIGREYEIIIALDATERNELLTQTKAYKEFIERNQDIQIGRFRLAS